MSQIITYSGEMVDLLNPDPAKIHITDIAHALSSICRFTGHARQHYSVAEHSVLLSQHSVGLGWAYAALMHDASEAYLGDVSTPLKELLPEYRKIEANFQSVIEAKFNVPPYLHVKPMDSKLCATELNILFGVPLKFQGYVATDRLYFWDQRTARQAFLARFVELNMDKEV